MIVWRFRYARGPQFGGTQHAFVTIYPATNMRDAGDLLPKSLCGRTRVRETVGSVPGYKSLPGARCKTCARMAASQQEFQLRPRGGV